MAETLLNLNQNNLDTQDASFVELIKSTQIGKREIAQALIDKGADVTANSSLIEMADQIQDLYVAEHQLLAVDFANLDSQQIQINQAGVEANVIKFWPQKNALMARLNNKFEIYKYNFEERMFERIAECVVPDYIEAGSQGYIWEDFAFSKDNTVIGWLDWANMYTVVLKMNWDTNTLSLLHTHTIVNQVGGRRSFNNGNWGNGGYNNLSGCGVSDDGSVMVIPSGTYDGMRVTYIDYLSDTDIISSNFPTVSTLGTYDLQDVSEIHYDKERNVMQAISRKMMFKEYVFNITDSSITVIEDKLVVSSAFLDYAQRISAPIVLWDKNLLVVACSDRNDSYDATFAELLVIDIVTDKVIAKIRYKDIVSIASKYSSSYNSSYSMPFNVVANKMTYVEKEDYIYFYLTNFTRAEFNKNTHKFEFINTNGTTVKGGYHPVYTFFGEYNSRGTAQFTFANENDINETLWITDSGGGRVSNGMMSTDNRFLHTTYLDKPIVIGAKFEKDNVETIFPNSNFTQANLEAGAYDLTTTKIEL